MRETASAPGGFDESEMYQILEQGCAAVGLDFRDARLLRGHTNAVVLLEREHVVVKIARKGSRVADVERTLPGVPRIRLPPASPDRCDGPAEKVLHLQSIA
jgi:hypothetical protein